MPPAAAHASRHGREEAGLHAFAGKRPAQGPAPTPVVPPPIAEVLRDLYEEEKKTA